MAVEWTSLLWLGIVVAAIPITLWFVKRTPLGLQAAAGTAKVVAVLPLSTTQRVVTVEVGRGDHRMWLLLGVTPQGITNLTTMAPQDDGLPTTPQSPADTFAPLLQRLRQAGRKESDGA